MLTSGIRSLRGLHACWRGKLMGPIFDCREAVMGPSSWRRTVCERVGERWCDGAGCMLYAYLGYPVITRLARMMVWLVDVTDFRPSRSGGGTEPVAAHSLRACRGAMARRGRLNAYLGFPVAPRLARMLAREVVGTDFRVSRNGDGAHSVAAHSLRACRGAMVRRRRLYAYLGYPVAPMLVGVGWM